MRYAPPYSADRFPADLIVSVLTGLAGAAVVGPVTWWLALRYLLRTYPRHPEMRSAAIVVAAIDGLFTVVLIAGLCLALRIWLFERRERRHSDQMLRDTLHQIHDERKHGRGKSGDLPPSPPRES